MTTQIKQLFSEISPTYDKLNHLLSLNIDKSWRRKTIQKIRHSRNSPLVALDLCAGTLDLSLEFLKEFPYSRVCALDFASPMLNRGLAKAELPQKSRLSVVCGDALRLPFKDQVFNVIFCGYGFRNLQDKEKGLQEIRRVLSTTGQILILDFFRPKRMTTKFFHHTYGQFLLPTVGRLISKNHGAYRYLHDSINQFYSTDECINLFENHGFTDISCKDFLMGISSVVVGHKG